MAKKLVIAFSLVLGISAEASAAGLNLPLDCKEGEIYPWFSGCTKYIRCDANGAEIVNCPAAPVPTGLSLVCGDSSPCGYSACDADTTDIIALTTAVNASSPYYALCNKGVVLYQSRCRSENSLPNVVFFDAKEKKCKATCKDDETIVSSDCKSYSQCVANSLVSYTCPDGSLFNGIFCSFTQTTCNQKQ